ncbi:MAG TPA: SEFIR domain-containing protein, partial [Enhygromyxa sp.]|nr:SEFIR domain-containing protein [Enhygromyxa sp.]
MIDATWFHRLQQSLEYAVGFELFLLVGPGNYAERGLARLAKELARFGPPRWHALDGEGLDGLLGGSRPGELHLVHGLERLPKPAARGLVARLNVNRGQLRELGAPVLFWVPERFYEEFVRQAPDLVAWRSQVDTVSVADFEGQEPGHEEPSPTVLGRPPRVFINYSHESELHRRRVLELAQRLRADGIDAWLDRFEPAPAQGWPRWLKEQVEMADFVLIVCTATSRHRLEDERGDSWEGMVLAQLLNEKHLDPSVIIPILLEGADDDDVPLMLRPWTRFKLPEDYAVLVRRLTERPGTATPLGEAPTFAGMPDSPDPTQKLATLEHELESRVAGGD